MKSEHYCDNIIAIITNYLPQATIYLFGSRARAEHKSGADVDLAIDVGRPISLITLGDIQEAFEESSIPLSIDIVDVYAAPAAFIDEIKKDWIVWYLPKK